MKLIISLMVCLFGYGIVFGIQKNEYIIITILFILCLAFIRKLFFNTKHFWWSRKED